ncbi:MAG: alpha/beta hydrolase [Chloroflexi bacterium]|nr:MAG: alpha/beta hydrolase [Chloroflexota bacterium]
MQPEVSIMALDLPGHGEAPPASDYHYGSLVAHVLEAVTGIDRFALLGHSVGAAVAWLIAARYPGRVTRLILVEPAAPHQSRFIHGPTPEPRHPYTYASADEALGAMRAFDSTVTEQEIRRDYRQRPDGRWEPGFDPAIFPPLVEDAKLRGQEFRRELAAITAPTLIVRGERSMLRPEQAKEILAELPSGRLVSVAGGTHFLQRQQPEELARLVREFLGGG